MLFMKLMKDGGPVMWIILALDVIALAVVLKKTLQFHREEISVRELLRGIFNVLRRHGFIEAVSLCDNTPGPVARMRSAAIAAIAHAPGIVALPATITAVPNVPLWE